MTFGPGTRLGAYEILSPLGAGAMGEVYRARDLNLQREVAVKVLPEAFAGDQERLARFEREARVLASLNHPHIASIHGLERSGPLPALVLELVEGHTLAERLEGGALPIPEAIEIALQISDALEAAHDRGIVHRDLKPANIKLTSARVVKVLDFGLAKALDPAPSAPADAPTVMSLGTDAGRVLGTAPYMSPEQVRGETVDERTDIWAFGCVLFEMLAGRRPFGGASAADVMAGILEHDPDWTKLPERTPDTARRVLRRCLQKDVRRRLRDIGDARLELEEPVAVRAADDAPQPQSRSFRHAPLWIAIGLAAGLLAAAAVFQAMRPDDASSEHLQAHQLTELAGLEESPAISPDGKSVAFTATVGRSRQVFVRLLASGPPLRITAAPAADHLYPRWSPDSGSITYFSPAATGEIQGTLWTVPALGGTPRRLGHSIGGGDINRADGRLAFFRLAERRIELVSAPADGAAASVVASFDPVAYYQDPRWSPDGKWIGFQRGDRFRLDVFMVPAGGGDLRQITHENSVINGFAWLPDSGGIVFSSPRGSTMPYLATSALWRIGLDGGQPRRLTSGELSYANPDVAADGSIVAARMRLQSDIWRFPVDGAPGENVQRGVRLTHQTAQVLTPTAAPTDREIAFLSDSGGHANLWVINTANGERRQITYERDATVAMGLPLWSPDGRAIAFVSSRGNPGLTFGVWLVDPRGSDLRQLVNPGLGAAWSPDGQWVYYSTRGDSSGGGSGIVLRKVRVGGGEPVTVRAEQVRNVIGAHGGTLYYLFEKPLVDGTPDYEIRAATPEDGPSRLVARISASRVPSWQIVNPALSPDGGSLAQPLTDGFTTDIWVLSASTGAWRRVTDFGDRATFIARRVSWSADGRSILAAVGEGDADVVLLQGLVRKR